MYITKWNEYNFTRMIAGMQLGRQGLSYLTMRWRSSIDDEGLSHVGVSPGTDRELGCLGTEMLSLDELRSYSFGGS